MWCLVVIALLTGRVVDSTGAALPGVTVEAGARATTTDAEGKYALDVGAGTHDVSFRLLNFATATKRVDAPGTLDATLYLSASADIVVTARETFREIETGGADAASAGVITARDVARRPFRRAGEILETIPGVAGSQHSGEGKANQYYLRGFNLDHGTDLAISIAGVPVNMPTHGHGQGYADANFLIPELLAGAQYRKGPYSAEEGDFSSAGAVNIHYLHVLDRPIAFVQGGGFGYGRVLVADSPRVGNGNLLWALEAGTNDGPWERPDDFRKWNGVLRYSQGDQRGGFSVTAMAYDATWNATDQIPSRAVPAVGRFGLIDDTDGGSTHRRSLSTEWQRAGAASLTQVSAYAIDSRLRLFSNFTYFLDDPENGDQFEQTDDRLVAGMRASHRWINALGEHAVGVSARHDAIDEVGLHRTRARQRLSTVREDAIAQTSAALFSETSRQWTPRLRTVAGLRADRYDFGARRASILSPKLSVIATPRRDLELYANAGYGFHSNDARTESEEPLVRTRGAELGLRAAHRGVRATVAAWGLDIDSELLFVGDAGTTEASRPSRRAGIEVAASVALGSHFALDAEYAWSRARFRDGSRIPGAVEGIASLGLSMLEWGELRARWFGPRPLIEDNSVRSDASFLIDARAGYKLTDAVRINVDVFNVLNAKANDVDYFYRSRLPGEPAEGVDDVHAHPVEPRSVRVSVSTTF